MSAEPKREEEEVKRFYKLRWRIESAFNKLKDFRRIATALRR